MKNKYNDLHGYEIIGLADAKKKSEKIDAYESHLNWLKSKEIEARHEIERKLVKLKRW